MVKTIEAANQSRKIHTKKTSMEEVDEVVLVKGLNWTIIAPNIIPKEEIISALETTYRHLAQHGRQSEYVNSRYIDFVKPNHRNPMSSTRRSP